jgi:hypothetical protein
MHEGFTNHYTLNEQTPKAVCTLNSKGERKKRRRKEEGEKKEGDDERATF